MIRLAFRGMRYIRRRIGRLCSAPHLFCTKIYASPKYTDRGCHKGTVRLFFDFLKWTMATGDDGSFFRYYGFDVRGRKADWNEYISEPLFWGRLIQLNYAGQSNYTCVLRDKYLFALYMSDRGIPMPEVIAFADRAGYYCRESGIMRRVTASEWLQTISSSHSEFFVKDATSCCGRGIAHVKVVNGEWIADGKRFLIDEWDREKGRLIVQLPIKNCDALNELNPYSLNTMRIVTVFNRENRRAELLFPGFLRIGCDKDKSVDNISAGGIGVGIDDAGRLREFGYRRPETGAVKWTCHPITHKVFKGLELPYYKEACELVLRAHSYLAEVPSIGWDVAFTDGGPCIIEGNDNWEISGPQMFSGGLRKRFEKLLGVR